MDINTIVLMVEDSGSIAVPYPKHTATQILPMLQAQGYFASYDYELSTLYVTKN